MAAMYEGPAAQAPLMTPTSDTTQSASKPAATPCNLDEYLGQFDPDERLDTKSVLKAFSPIGREFKFNAESMEKYVAVDGSFRAGDGKVLIPFLLDLVQAKVKGYAADFWLKRFFPDLDITVKPSQTGSTFTLAID